MSEWLKQLRQRYAASTVVTLRTILSMILDDAVDERLIAVNPVRRRGRRRDRMASPCERVWAMPEHVLRIAEQASMLGGPSAGLLVISTVWTGCRWGEMAGLQRDQVDLDRGVITIDPDIGALHESAHRLWLGPPKTQRRPAPSRCRHSWSPSFVTISPAALGRLCSPARRAIHCGAAHLTAGCSGLPSMVSSAKAPIRSGPV